MIFVSSLKRDTLALYVMCLGKKTDRRGEAGGGDIRRGPRVPRTLHMGRVAAHHLDQMRVRSVTFSP